MDADLNGELYRLQFAYFAINVSEILIKSERDGPILVQARVSTEGEWLHFFFKRNESEVALLTAQKSQRNSESA